VEVFEREARPGGALRYAGRAPQDGEVVARPAVLETYVAEPNGPVGRRCVTLRYGSRASPETLVGFDRVIVATGARYRLGTGPLVRRLLDAGVGWRRRARRLFAHPAVSAFLYYRARRGTGDAVRRG